MAVAGQRLEAHLATAGHDRARPDTAGVLHRPADPAARTPARTPSPPTATPGGCCSRFAAARTGTAPLDCWTSTDLDAPLIAGVPGPPRTRPRQQRPHPQRPPGRDPLAVPLRRAGPSRTRRSHLPGPGDPTQTLRPGTGHLPHRRPRSTRCSAACDQTTWTGRRDHALLLLAVQTGLRISELIGLTRARRAPRRRRARRLPRQGPQGPDHPADQRHRHRAARLARPNTTATPDAPLFPTRRGGTLSRDADRTPHRPLRRHWPPTDCPSLHDKTITAHVLRHTTAMRLLHAGVDTSVIALWLGHVSIDTTQIYLHADLTLKEQALARTRPPNSTHRPIPAPRHPPRLARSASDYADLASTEPLSCKGISDQHRHNPEVGIMGAAPLPAGSGQVGRRSLRPGRCGHRR